MRGRHGANGAVDRGSEVVVAARLGLAGQHTDTHRQFERQLCSDCCLDGRFRQREGGEHAIAGVLEQPAAMPFDRIPQRGIMFGQRRAHRFRLFFPIAGSIARYR